VVLAMSHLSNQEGAQLFSGQSVRRKQLRTRFGGEGLGIFQE